MRSLSYLAVWLFVIPSASAVDFDKDVKPVLERRCAKCHAYGERKGGLSMETRESLLKGGEDGKVVEAGKTKGSLFLELLEEEDDADLQVSMAKAWCSDATRRVVAHGQQIHGGIGFTKEYIIQLFFRRQKMAELMWGDGDYHREKVAKLLEI